MDAEEQDGLTARWVSRDLHGSCNFCCRDHRKVYVVKGISGLRTLGVRLCQKCMDELRAQTRRRK